MPVVAWLVAQDDVCQSHLWRGMENAVAQVENLKCGFGFGIEVSLVDN